MTPQLATLPFVFAAVGAILTGTWTEPWQIADDLGEATLEREVIIDTSAWQGHAMTLEFTYIKVPGEPLNTLAFDAFTYDGHIGDLAGYGGERALGLAHSENPAAHNRVRPTKMFLNKYGVVFDSLGHTIRFRLKLTRRPPGRSSGPFDSISMTAFCPNRVDTVKTADPLEGHALFAAEFDGTNDLALRAFSPMVARGDTLFLRLPSPPSPACGMEP